MKYKSVFNAKKKLKYIMTKFSFTNMFLVLIHHCSHGQISRGFNMSLSAAAQIQLLVPLSNKKLNLYIQQVCL